MNIATGHIEEAATLIREFHYSHRVPANIQLCVTWHAEGGLFGDLGPAIAAVLFSIPPTRWSEEVWELSRLVRSDDAQISLTRLISRAVKLCKGRIDLLVSFADWTQHHHGGIYQAATWNYAGMRKPTMDGVLVEGVFVPGRSSNRAYGTTSPRLLSQKLGKDVIGHYDEGKHLYWRALSREGERKAERLGLECLPYPEPSLKSALDLEKHRAHDAVGAARVRG